MAGNRTPKGRLGRPYFVIMENKIDVRNSKRNRRTKNSYTTYN